VVVLVPGLDSAKEEFRSTEALFLERGVGTFSVDGPGQGEAEYDLPIQGDWAAPGAAILDAVSAQDGVDPDRIGVWGVSLGGYYAPRIAAADPRVRACVALAGPYDFGECWEALPPLTRGVPGALPVRRRPRGPHDGRLDRRRADGVRDGPQAGPCRLRRRGLESHQRQVRGPDP
jgi:2,6-dihydroxypseudooxynicotine hydrolase